MFLLCANLEDYLPLLSVFSLQHIQISFSPFCLHLELKLKKCISFVTGFFSVKMLEKCQIVLGNMAQTNWLIVLFWCKVTQRGLGVWGRFGEDFSSSVRTENRKHPRSAWNKQINKETLFFPRQVKKKRCNILTKAIQNLPPTHTKGGILNLFLKIKGQETWRWKPDAHKQNQEGGPPLPNVNESEVLPPSLVGYITFSFSASDAF